MSFHETSYARQAEHMECDFANASRRPVHEAWFEAGTADYWRNIRKFEAVDYLRLDSGASWLTVGDGRYGLDSIEIRARGVENVTPTDITESLLKKAKEDGRIDRYSVENAEALSFAAGSFDYVFCKDAYHHFPRPHLALYEMLRVARKAVVLIEPNDIPKPVALVEEPLRKLAGLPRPRTPADYEPSGNYIYTLSRRELEKVALGMNLPAIATKGLCDHYIAGCEFARAQWRDPIYLRIRARCLLQSALARTAIRDKPILMTVLFITDPDVAIADAFRQHGWDLRALPRNPHVR